MKGFFDRETKRLVKNSSWIFLSNFYSTGLAFVRSILIARGLGAMLFGSYVMVVAFVGLVQEFMNLNLGTAIIRFGAVFQARQRPDQLFSLVKTCLRVSFIMLLASVGIIAVLSYTSYSHFIHQPGLTFYVIAYAFASGLTYFNSISRGVLRLYFKFRITSMIEIIMDTIETLAVAYVIWRFPHDLDAFFPAIIIARFLNGAILNYMAYSELYSEWRPHLHVSGEVMADDRKEVRHFVLGNSVGNTLKTMITQGDVLLLGLLTSPVQVAYYAVAKKLAYAVLTLTDPLTSSIYPQLSKLIAERKFPEVKLMLRKISTFAAAPALLLLAVMFFVNSFLVTTFYGQEFRPASDSFMYFFTAALLGAVTFWTLPLVQSLGLVRMRVYAYLVTIVVGVLVSLTLIPRFQAEGMAIALMFTNILNATIFIYFTFLTIRKMESVAPPASV